MSRYRYRRQIGKAVSVSWGWTIFGEMALLDQGKRSADVEVKADLTCYKITIGSLEELKEEHPGVALIILDTLSKVLVARVRQLTETVAELER